MLDTLDPVSLLIFLIAALVAEVVGTIAGFGITTILLPVATLLLGVKEAIALVGLFHFMGELVDGVIWRKYINWRIGFLFSIFGVFFSILGAYLVVYSPANTIEMILGAFLIIYSLYSLSGKELKLPKGDLSLVLAGGVSGFLAGILGTAGAIRTAAISTLKLNKEQFLGTTFAIAFMVDLVRVIVYGQTGLLNVTPGLIVPVAGVAILGSLIGRAFVKKISNKLFYRIIYTALLIAGLKFLIFP